MAGPGFLVASVVDLDRASAFALQVLVLSTGFAAYAFGGIMATHWNTWTARARRKTRACTS